MKLKIFILLILFQSLSISDEYNYRVYLKNFEDINALSRLCSIDKVYPDSGIRINVTDRELPSVQPYLRLMKPILRSPQNIVMTDSIEYLMEHWDRYPTYEAYINIMRYFEQAYPTLCQLDTIGYSTNRRLLLFLQITQGLDNNASRPEVQLTSTMHGDETTGYILMLRLIHYLLSQYSRGNQEAQTIINNVNLWINPNSNPDGTYHRGNQTVEGAVRRNPNGYDLNRSFPDQYADPNNTTTSREAEVAAMMNFAALRHFSLSANFHEGAIVVNYPWDGLESGRTSWGITHHCPDSLWFIQLSLGYASRNPLMANSTEFENGITNGTQWYTVYGGRQDWIYAFHQCREVTIELYNEFTPSSSKLPLIWEQNRDACLFYIQQSLKGIKGTVTDENGLPLTAEIELQEIPEQDVYSNQSNGHFFRYVLPGTYNLKVSKEGYQTQTINNITVSENLATTLEITLMTELQPIQTSADSVYFSAWIGQSDTQSFNITTNSETSAIIDSILFSHNNFFSTDSSIFNFTIHPNSTFRINLYFNPASGQLFHDTLMIYYNSQEFPKRVYLFGQGKQQNITLLRPNGNETFHTGDTISISLTRNTCLDSIQISAIRGNQTILAIDTIAPLSDTITCQWAIPETTQPGQYKIKASLLRNTQIYDCSDTCFTIVNHIVSLREDTLNSKLPILLHNYPNPFSESTTISFIPNDQTPLNLIIYNLQGEMIRQFRYNQKSNQIIKQTINTFNWKTGTYFYRLQNRNYKSKTNKMCLIK